MQDTGWEGARALESVDSLIATLNTVEVGELKKIRERLLGVRGQLEMHDFGELVTKLDACLEALEGGDMQEFRRLKATIVSRLGHLR